VKIGSLIYPDGLDLQSQDLGMLCNPTFHAFFVGHPRQSKVAMQININKQ